MNKNSSSNDLIDIAIIGGTGIYDNNLFHQEQIIKPHTPYGPTSDFIVIGRLNDKKIAFLPRHGKGHRIPPHMINYRANIWALKELGVKRIIAPSAVGSLNYDYKPGDIMLPDQFIDFTRKRNYSFFDGPRFSTRAESKLFRDVYHADIIGMTLVPECILARESEICYLSISTITDYDVWAEQPVSSKNIIDILNKN